MSCTCHLPHSISMSCKASCSMTLYAGCLVGILETWNNLEKCHKTFNTVFLIIIIIRLLLFVTTKWYQDVSNLLWDLCPVIWGNLLYTARMLMKIKNNAKKCFNKQNNHSVCAHSSFLVHFLAITQDYKFHVLCIRALRHKTTILFLFFLELVLDAIHNNSWNSRNICVHITNGISNHDEIWNIDAISVLKWCFCCCCLMVT